jgi:hypothetical protein
VHEERRQREHHADRQVDLPADEQQDDPHRDDRHRRGRLGDVHEVGALEEDRRCEAEVHHQADGDDEDARLAAVQEPAAEALPDGRRPGAGAALAYRRRGRVHPRWSGHAATYAWAMAPLRSTSFGALSEPW